MFTDKRKDLQNKLKVLEKYYESYLILQKKLRELDALEQIIQYRKYGTIPIDYQHIIKKKPHSNND